MRFVTNPIGPVIIARPTPSGSGLRGSWANTGGANPGAGGSLSFSRGSASVFLRIALCRAWRTTCTATCMALLEKQTPRCSLVVTQTAREYFECD